MITKSPVGSVPEQEGVVIEVTVVVVADGQANDSHAVRELTVFLLVITPPQTFHTYHTPLFHFALQADLSITFVLFDCQFESLHVV